MSINTNNIGQQIPFFQLLPILQNFSITNWPNFFGIWEAAFKKGIVIHQMFQKFIIFFLPIFLKNFTNLK